jgi:transcriptional regulator with XRE-family HTH domain
MHYLDQFGAAVRAARQEKDLSQRALASKLNMSYRTILDLENGNSSPRAETAFLIASELDISLDAIIFDEGSDAVSPAVFEFFSGKTQEEANRYIALCRQAAALSK